MDECTSACDPANEFHLHLGWMVGKMLSSATRWQRLIFEEVLSIHMTPAFSFLGAGWFYLKILGKKQTSMSDGHVSGCFPIAIAMSAELFIQHFQRTPCCEKSCMWTQRGTNESTDETTLWKLSDSFAVFSKIRGRKAMAVFIGTRF